VSRSKRSSFRVISLLRVGLEHVKFDAERTLRAVESDYTQATDLAEALALKGVPFRTAYQLVGRLVRTCQDQGLPLARATAQMARQIDPRFDDEVLRAADPRASVARKRNAGGTGPAQVQEQIDALERQAARAAEAARAVPRLHDLFGQLRQADL
jgi:argininosuccinate lyase